MTEPKIIESTRRLELLREEIAGAQQVRIHGQGGNDRYLLGTEIGMICDALATLSTRPPAEQPTQYPLEHAQRRLDALVADAPPAQPSVPEGWHMVPKKWTQEMMAALLFKGNKMWADGMTAALAAAPQPPTDEKE